MRGISKVLAFLQTQPYEWHYGMDIAKQADVSRGTVYIYLGQLEEQGKVRRRLDPGPRHSGSMPRTQYQITVEGQREPAHIDGGALA